MPKGKHYNDSSKGGGKSGGGKKGVNSDKSYVKIKNSSPCPPDFSKDRHSST